MKKLAFIVASAGILSLSGCKKEESKTTDTAVVSKENQEDFVLKNGDYCFLKVTAGKDSTKLKVSVKDNLISGTMEFLPFEKDSSKGTFKGSKNAENDYDVVFDYFQEGQKDSEKLIFKFDEKEMDIEGQKYDTDDIAMIPCK